MVDRAGAERAEAARIAVVVVTFNSSAVLPGCLAALAVQEGIDLAGVVVADNASRDGCVGIAEATGGLPVQSVAVGRNAGYAAAINAGLAVLDLRKLDAVLVLNPDCRPHPDALRRLAAVLRQPGRGIAAPRLLNPDGSLQASLRRRATVGRALAEAVAGGNRAGRVGTLSEMAVRPGEYDRPAPVVWATGAAMLLSAGMIRDIGPWDESFLLYSEETEYCLRAADHGWTTWYEPAAVVEHLGGDSATDPRLYALMVANKVTLYRRRHRPPATFAYHLTVTAGEAARALLGRATSRAALAALLSPARHRALITSIAGGSA